MVLLYCPWNARWEEDPSLRRPRTIHRGFHPRGARPRNRGEGGLFSMKIVVLAGGLSTERQVSLVTGGSVCRALRSRGHQAILVDMFLGLEGYEGPLAGIFDAPDGLRHGGHRLPGPPRRLRRGWPGPGGLRPSGHPLYRRRVLKQRHGHGQGRHQAGDGRRRRPHRPLEGHPSL